MVQISVGALLNKHQGTRETHSINQKLDFSSEGLTLTAPFVATIDLVKLDHEISVNVKEATTKAIATCSRCLREFELPIIIRQVAREFIIDLPKESIQAGEEVFFVDKGSNQITLDDMIRQEVLLHFPPITVCSPSCKGLCDRCGANLNDANCSCPPKVETNPFTTITI